MSLALVLLFSLCSRLPAAEEPRITVAMGNEEIYEGQSVIYRVRVENVEGPPAPELRGTEDFDVASLGQQSLDSQQITIINGNVRQIVRRGREFRYRLTPKRSGEIVIPGPVVKLAGKTLTGDSLRLKVLPPGAQDLAAVELTTDRPTVYPTQPLTVTLSVFVKELPPPVSDRDPLSVQNPPPMLQIPWLIDQELPSGLSPNEEWQKWIKQFIDRGGVGFGINNLAQESMFSFFNESNVIAFRSKPRSVVRPDGQGRDARYVRYDFSRTFTAKQAGPLTFGAVSLQGTFAAGVSGGRLNGKEIFATSKPLVVAVKDVPTEGRPENFLGAIGRYEVSASLTPQQSKVGDPMTFTLNLRGSGSLAAVKPPELGKFPEVAKRFKVYDATQKTAADGVNFVYSLRPLAEGDEPFPAVSLAYFDVDREQYASIQTAPIPLKVSRAEQLSGDQIVASPRAGGAAKELEARSEGIFANISDVGLVHDQRVRPARWLAGLGGCAALYGLVVAATVLLRRRLEDKVSLRRRAAAGHARQRLRAAVTHWQAQQVREAADLIQESLTGLIADVADLHDAGLTPKDVQRHLHAWQFPEALAARVSALMDSCDAARYGGAATSGDLGEEAQQVLDAVLETLHSQRRFR